MATIRTNDNAPADSVKYVFPLETFDLAPGGEFETKNRDTIASAHSHPWLVVEEETVDELGGGDWERRSVPYEEDVLAAPNSKAFDVEAIKADREEQRDVVVNHTAIQAGLDQGESVEVADVAFTVAADEAQDDEVDDDKKENE